MGEKQRSQIEMSDAEVRDFLEQSRTATMATIGPDGMPHLVAMWFGLIDGEVWFETKAKSQKVVNLRRDNRMTVMVEDGLTYDTLRGVALEGTAEVVEDPDALWALGRECLGALQRPVLRRGQALRRSDAQQAGSRSG
jgi:PPOX class probable F420-dependent enzyme